MLLTVTPVLSGKRLIYWHSFLGSCVSWICTSLTWMTHLFQIHFGVSYNSLKKILLDLKVVKSDIMIIISLLLSRLSQNFWHIVRFPLPSSKFFGRKILFNDSTMLMHWISVVNYHLFCLHNLLAERIICHVLWTNDIQLLPSYKAW